MERENYQHEEIYQALSELTQVCRNLETRVMERDKKVDEMVAKVEEMYKVFNNGSFLVSVIKWGFGLILAIGGAYIMFKDILHK
jgi:hypothetical protein